MPDKLQSFFSKHAGPIIACIIASMVTLVGQGLLLATTYGHDHAVLAIHETRLNANDSRAEKINDKLEVMTPQVAVTAAQVTATAASVEWIRRFMEHTIPSNPSNPSQNTAKNP